MIKSVKALAISFWNVCKQLPGYYQEKFEAWAADLERANKLRVRGGYTAEEKETIAEFERNFRTAVGGVEDGGNDDG